MKKDKKNNGVEHIGAVIQNVLKTYQCESDGNLAQVWHLWDRTVGETIAANAQPEAFKGRILLVTVLLSLGVQVITIIAVQILAIGLGVDIPWYSYYIFIPLTVLISMIPVTISGFGVREGAMVYFFGLAGVSNHTAISLSFIWYGSVMAANLVGGIEYVRGGYKEKSNVSRIEEIDSPE